MGWGTLDASYQGLITKLDELSVKIEGSTEAILELQGVMVKLDKQNNRLQIIGIILALVGAIDVLLRLSGG